MKYRMIGDEVEAILIDETFLGFPPAWGSIAAVLSPVSKNLKFETTNQGTISVPFGEYLIRDRKGRFWHQTAQTFAEFYHPIAETAGT